ncbi:MAG: hypothetical protein WBZ36_11565 [Candidatus Nitrosopolaris sp.]
MISIGKLVRKDDGPEGVEQIISTMIKYAPKKNYRYFGSMQVEAKT